MTVTADRFVLERAIQDAIQDQFPIKTSVTVYLGTIVTFVAATGRITNGVPATTAAGVAGVLVDFLNDSGAFLGSNITGDTAGDVYGIVRWNHEATFNVKTSARTFANLNKTAYLYQNDTVSGVTAAGTTALQIPVGRIASFTDSTKAVAYVVIRTQGASNALGA